MAVAITASTVATVPPQAEPKQAQNNGSKLPKDNTAAGGSPKETKTAVDNTFGKVPQDGKEEPKKPASDAKSAPSEDKASPAQDTKTTPSGSDAKSAADANAPADPKAPPAGEGKTAPAAGAPENPKLAVTVPDAPAPDPKSAAVGDTPSMPPVDPKVQSILDSKLSDGKSVKEKFDADSPTYIMKAAQDHYNLQKEKGEALDAISNFYLNNVGKALEQQGVREMQIPPENLGGVFDADKINKNIEELTKDPAFGKWLGEQQANAIEDTIAKNPDIAKLIDPYKLEGENYVNALRRMQSDYMTSQDFADGVAKAASPDDGRNLVKEGLTTLSSLGLGEKETLGVANTLSENIRSKYNPDAPKVVIDAETNKAVATEDGYNLATLPDGTYIAVNTDGKAVADKQGNPYVYNADRTAKVDANNAYVQYHAKAQTTFASYRGIHYLVGADGKTTADAQGQPLIIDKDGGAPVALGADGKVAVDAQGNKAVINPATGKQVVDPDNGNKVVIDAKTKAVVQTGADGKVVAGANGDPYAVDQKSGGFVKDAAGRYVQISKENVAPGIVPGYVVDANNTKVVVNPITGKPVIDPSLGKTVIFTPGTNAPELVPLDAGGKPLLAEDGLSIVYDKGGNTIVKGSGQGPNWLVTSDGKYAHDGNGHYIGVGARSGIATPVDAKGAPVETAGGHLPLWDPKTNALMVTADGQNNIVLDKSGALLAASPEGHAGVESQTGLPFLIDPKTMSVAVNPDSGRWIMLDKSGAAVEYNADDGYKYLINPKTNTTVKTAEGQVIVIDDAAAMPVGVNADGSKVRNPETGNTVVYNVDGKAAVDKQTGGKIEITPDGKAHLIDPKTQAPVGTYDKSTGGTQLYNKDGSDLLDPATGNKVQLDPNGHHVEVDATTGKFATDAFGNTLILGPDNTALKMPNGNAVVVDKQTGSPIGVDAGGKVEVDPDSGLPRAINVETGKLLEDPVSKASVVVDPKTGAPVQVDKNTGVPIADPVTGLNIVANAKTGEQAKGPGGEPIGVAPNLNLPVYYDKQINTLTVADPQTGQPVTNPKTGAKLIIDPQYGVPVQVVEDVAGKLVLVDDIGRPRDDGLGNVLFLDKETGQVVIQISDGKMVDALTMKAPEKVDAKEILKHIPVMPPGGAGVGGKDTTGGAPGGTAPDAAKNAGNGGPPPTESGPPPQEPIGVPGTSGTQNGSVIPPPRNEAWAQPNYVSTPADRAEFIKYYKEITGLLTPYADEADAIDELKKIRPELKDIDTTDLVALKAYTRGGKYKDLIAAMNGSDATALAKFEPQIKGIMSAVNQLKKIKEYAYEGPAVRWLNPPMTLQKFNDTFQGGSYFRNKQVMSASADPNWKWKGNVKINFEKLKGTKVDFLSAFPEQQEVIGDINGLYQTKNIDSWPDSQVGLFAFGKTVTVTQVDDPTDRGKSVFFEDIDYLYSEPIVKNADVIETVDDDVKPPDTQPAPTTTATAGGKAAGKWSKLGKVLGYGAEVLGIATGAAQAVMGGYQIDNGVKGKDSYEIAAGSLNVASGAMAVGSGVAAIAGGAVGGVVGSVLLAIAAPLAIAAAVAGVVATIVEGVGKLDDGEEFADAIEQKLGHLGILKDGWRDKVVQAYNEAMVADSIFPFGKPVSEAVNNGKNS